MENTFSRPGLVSRGFIDIYVLIVFIFIIPRLYSCMHSTLPALHYPTTHFKLNSFQSAMFRSHSQSKSKSQAHSLPIYIRCWIRCIGGGSDGRFTSIPTLCGGFGGTARRAFGGGGGGGGTGRRAFGGGPAGGTGRTAFGGGPAGVRGPCTNHNPSAGALNLELAQTKT